MKNGEWIVNRGRAKPYPAGRTNCLRALSGIIGKICPTRQSRYYFLHIPMRNPTNPRTYAFPHKNLSRTFNAMFRKHGDESSLVIFCAGYSTSPDRCASCLVCLLFHAEMMDRRAAVGFSRLKHRTRKFRLVRRIGKMLRFQAKCAVFLVFVAKRTG